MLEDAKQNISQFSNSYAPTQAWIDGLPEFSRNFDIAADLVLRVQQEIQAGSGPTDQQYQIVKQALQTLTVDLKGSSDQPNRGTQALANSLEQQSSYREKISQAIGGADQSAIDALEVIKGHANNFAVVREHSECQGVFNEKFIGIRGDFSRSITEIDSAFKKLGDSSQKAQTSLAVLLGSVVSSRTTIQSVQDLLNAAKKDRLGSFLEQLHLTAAKKQWKDLADSYVK